MNGLDKQPLWKEANYVAKYMYESLSDMPDDEKWDTASKLKHTAGDLVLHCGLALGGDISPASSQFDWENVRRYAFGLKAVYLFAVDQDFIDIEPEIVVKLDKIIRSAEEKYALAEKALEERQKRDVAPWQEKYRLWKEMQE